MKVDWISLKHSTLWKRNNVIKVRKSYAKLGGKIKKDNIISGYDFPLIDYVLIEHLL